MQILYVVSNMNSGLGGAKQEWREPEVSRKQMLLESEKLKLSVKLCNVNQ